MIIGVTALVLVASILACKQLFSKFPHDKMWSALCKALSFATISEHQESNIREKSTEVVPKSLWKASQIVVKETSEKHTTVSTQTPQLEVVPPSFSFDHHDDHTDMNNTINDQEEEEEEEEEEDDDDCVPSFPAINSAQRASGGTTSLRNSSRSITMLPPSSSISRSMAPPPIPIRNKNAAANARMSVSPTFGVSKLSSFSSSSTGSSLGGTPTQGSFLQTHKGGGLSSLSPPSRLALPPSSTLKLQKPRKKVILTPGHSPLDWARLQQSGTDLRGVSFPNLVKVTPSELKKHNKDNDCWIALEDRVYNATPYLLFHPGGGKEIMRIAGRDGTKMYMNAHSWVSHENMLKGCLIGMLVPENKMEEVSKLDEMD